MEYLFIGWLLGIATAWIWRRFGEDYFKRRLGGRRK